MSLVNIISSIDTMDMLTVAQGNNQKETVKEQFSKLVKEKKAEYITKIENGGLEQSFQIGSGSYTETEWKKLLAGFDAAQSKLREATEESKAEVQEKNKTETSDDDKDSNEKSMEMLLAECTTATYPSSDTDALDDVYATFYMPDGIYCRKQGQSGIVWQIPLEDESQFEKVISYLQSLDTKNNLRFACHENFWQDFLSDQIDMDRFNDFLETRVVDGVPDYLDVYETGVKINADAAQYSKYMNQPGFGENMCYTSKEAFETFFHRNKESAGLFNNIF